MEHYRIVVDSWRMFKQFRPLAENTERFFCRILAAAQEIMDAHPEHKQFAASILMPFVEELRKMGEQG